MKIVTIPTSPIEGQKTGTSGLRKKVAHVRSIPNYVENWLQALMNALGGAQKGATLALGGDGRFLNAEAAVAAVEVLAANGVAKVVVGQNVLLSTPATSCLIRERKMFGGLIMTASHNPAGPSGDWGIKFNASNGEPAPEKLTDKIFKETLSISDIKRAELGLTIADFAVIGTKQFSKNFQLEVVNPVDAYVELLRSIFDFPTLRTFVARPDFALLFDGMHAVTGVYARRIFCEELFLPSSSLQNCAPSEDFNGGHPDPNLVYAKDLVDKMMGERGCPVLGAASDGDGDRNMIMGSNWFVTPSDSLAILADYATEAIPYFAKRGLVGVARSMPTSRAVDLVCAARNLRCFETPTGWKYFGNLMDAGLVGLCGEESFGTGSDHIREKDGIWAVLAWLSVVAHVTGGNEKKISSIRAINEAHWDKYGRHAYCRCDYEEVDAGGANSMMDHLRGELGSLVGREMEKGGFTVDSATEYNYIDPVDLSEAKGQGIIICFKNGSRLVFRLSGTGSAGATIRIYMEHYLRDWRAGRGEVFDGTERSEESLESGPLMRIALAVSQIEKFTGRCKPSVVT